MFLVKLCQVQLSDGNSDLPHHRHPHIPEKNMWTLEIFTVVEHSGRGWGMVGIDQATKREIMIASNYSLR